MKKVNWNKKHWVYVQYVEDKVVLILNVHNEEKKINLKKVFIIFIIRRRKLPMKISVFPCFF